MSDKKSPFEHRFFEPKEGEPYQVHFMDGPMGYDEREEMHARLQEVARSSSRVVVTAVQLGKEDELITPKMVEMSSRVLDQVAGLSRGFAPGELVTTFRVDKNRAGKSMFLFNATCRRYAMTEKHQRIEARRSRQARGVRLRKKRRTKVKRAYAGEDLN